ncbi:LPXTG cell wall anchor domain-containing protein [Streptococcus suis]|uniref:LPXTG cell wall anchor domain-containing protein n=1 Tax=Streptococcus suis TaxID=1307 RepID=UPI001ABDAD39|nr:LPXTG cell wall anchor domain-containing protein [Streptococcus suis]MBO4125508.1 LPXTG cell wall anchor domain-containing protein [Streptococcus suis]MBS8085406.1 LPXTG cell wall anchor domain-containing protein [Streptococcus suis]
MKKKAIVKPLLTSAILLALLGGATLPSGAVPVVAAETSQSTTYHLTDDEKVAVREYIQAKMTIDMQEYSLAFLEGMMEEMASGSAEAAWDEEIADLKANLTAEQVVVLDELEANLIGSIAQHYHYLFETLTVAGKSGREEAAAIVSKYESEDDASTPEAELAALKYAREVIVELLNKESAAIDNYIAYAEATGQELAGLLESGNSNLETITSATIGYGQALATASQPKFPYDFSEIDRQIAELTASLQSKVEDKSTANIENTGAQTSQSATNGSNDLQDVPGQGDGQISDVATGKGSISEAGQKKVMPNDNAKVLPKTSGESGLPLAVLGLITIFAGWLLTKKQEEK